MALASAILFDLIAESHFIGASGEIGIARAEELAVGIRSQSISENDDDPLAFSRFGFDFSSEVQIRPRIECRGTVCAIFPRTQMCHGMICEPESLILSPYRNDWHEVSNAVGDTQVPRLNSADVPALDRFYPLISKRLGEEGTVVTYVLIDPDGHVLDAMVSKSCGFMRLDAAAVEFAKMLRFFPFSSKTRVYIEYKVEFKLSPTDPPQR